MEITIDTTMFVRFRQSPRRLYLNLAETRREGGKVRHDYVANLGAIAAPPTIADRIDFWTRLHQRLGRLANRLDDALRAKILGAVRFLRAGAKRRQ
jgi:monoamine oxidase